MRSPWLLSSLACAVPDFTVAPTTAHAAAMQATLERLSSLYTAVYGRIVTAVVKYVSTGAVTVSDLMPTAGPQCVAHLPLVGRLPDRSKQAGAEYRNLTLACLHHILTLSCIKLFQQLAKHDEDLPKSSPAAAYLAPVVGPQLTLHPFAEKVSRHAPHGQFSR